MKQKYETLGSQYAEDYPDFIIFDPDCCRELVVTAIELLKHVKMHMAESWDTQFPVETENGEEINRRWTQTLRVFSDGTAELLWRSDSSTDYFFIELGRFQP